MIASYLLGTLLLWAPPAPVAPAAVPTPAPSVDANARVISDGPVAVTAKVSPDPSYIGDILSLEVVAAYPKDVTVNLPIGLNFDPLHLVGIEESPPEATGEGLRKTFTIKLQYFAVGSGKIPGFPVTWVGSGDEVHTLEVPPRAFEVDALLANEPDPIRRDEDPPVSIEYPNVTAERIIYGAFICLLAGLIGWIIARRYYGREKVIVGPPPIPAHEVALSALDELEQGDLVGGGQFSDYYVQLTEIAKGYIEGRFGVDALDRTTEEIRRQLTRRPSTVEPLDANEIVRFLQTCDLVKFARFAPPVDEAEGALGDVRRMVTTSLPKGAGATEGQDQRAADPASPHNEAERSPSDEATDGQTPPDRPSRDGPAEAAPADAAPTDAAPTDAGSAQDGPTEAGSTEAGSTESGPTEAGSTDAGPTEAGPTEGAFAAKAGQQGESR